MLSRRTSVRSTLVAIGVGAAITLSYPVPAFAANEGNYPLSTSNCAAVQEIQLKYVNGGWHDEQELNPSISRGGCLYQLTDNGQQISNTSGAGSGWWYDGPGHTICAYIYDFLTNPTSEAVGICN
ncbi:hypothetical protein [Streptomyces shenzhenensis]|uniref:hypothetical protein n=1 Tax=Streptomyces shenzhenensis TaxID=943815 RepID=UPI0015F00FAF|nr:hypothetical protein [Streptomyces shenzhenensis]